MIGLVSPGALAALVNLAESSGDDGIRTKIGMALPSLRDWNAEQCRVFAGSLTLSGAAWLHYEFGPAIARYRQLLPELAEGPAIARTTAANSDRWARAARRAGRAVDERPE